MNDLMLENGEIKINNGDMVIGDAILQNQLMILRASKGDVKSWPGIGVNISNVLLEESPDSLVISIKREFKKDGMLVKNVTVDKQKIKIDASYENL